MLSRCAGALVLITITVRFAHCETFLATITKVEGNKVTYKKASYNRDAEGSLWARYSYEEPVTVEATKEAAITTGHFVPAEGRITTEGRITGKTFPVEGGLGNERFKKLPQLKTPSRPSLITIADKGDDKGKLTAINVWKSAAPK
jgi:hypothetical protein